MEDGAWIADKMLPSLLFRCVHSWCLYKKLSVLHSHHALFLLCILVEQVDVASEGVALLINTGGAAADCIRRLGGGLTMEQLRRIYSSSSVSPQVQPKSTNINKSTRYWNDLDRRCEQVEIAIAGAAKDSPESTLFSDIVFEAGETYHPGYYSSSSLHLLMQHLNKSEGAIAFVSLSTVLSDKQMLEFYDVAPVAVQNHKGKFVGPAAAVFDDSSYALSRRLYMTLLNHEDSLVNTRPFLEFGYSDQGDQALVDAGFWPIHDWEKIVMNTRAQTETGIRIFDTANSCGPAGSTIDIAGSSTVFPVARIWVRIYEVICNVNIILEGGGSSDGAGRVCANKKRGTPVHIGNMSRQWKTKEAEKSGEFVYSCLKGDPSRSAIQVDVAVDGLTVATQVGGFADECIRTLGGLSIDQLRWIYSDYDEVKLEKTGWDPASLKNSDRDPKTHLFNELDPRCPRIEIRIAGADSESGTYEYFKQTVLKDHDNGESFDVNRPIFGYRNSEDDEVLVDYVQTCPEAISFFGYAYYFEHKDSLAAVPIENDEGTFVVPTEDTISDGTYNPLARPIFMNLLNNDEALEATVPFVKFGLKQRELVSSTGFVPISRSSTTEMIARIDGGPWEASTGVRLVITSLTVPAMIMILM